MDKFSQLIFVTCSSFMSLFYVATASIAALLVTHLVKIVLQQLNKEKHRREFFQGKHVWLTGASMGIGEKIACVLAENGARVSLTSRNIHLLDTIVRNINNSSKNRDVNINIDQGHGHGHEIKLAQAVPCDFQQCVNEYVHTTWNSSNTPLDDTHSTAASSASSTPSLDAVYQQVIQRFGDVDVLIANAGVNHGDRDFIHLDAHDIHRVIAVNLESLIHCVRLVLPSMVQRSQKQQQKNQNHTRFRIRSAASKAPAGGPVICGISSLAAVRGLPKSSVYSATKAAVTTFLESIRVELYDHHVSVVCIHPGFVRTSAIEDCNNLKPFICSARHAAEEIVDAIVRRESVYGFPWIMHQVVSRFQSWLGPYPLYDYIMYKLASLQRKRR